jgi:hypothetical protein
MCTVVIHIVFKQLIKVRSNYVYNMNYKMGLQDKVEVIK